MTVPFSWPNAEDAIAELLAPAAGGYPTIWEWQNQDRPSLGIQVGQVAAYLTLDHDDGHGVSDDPEYQLENNPDGEPGVPPTITFTGTGTQVITISGGIVGLLSGVGWHGDLVCSVAGAIGTSTFAWTIKDQNGVVQASGTVASSNVPQALGSTRYIANFSGGAAVQGDDYNWPTPIVGTELLESYSVQKEAHLQIQVHSVTVKGSASAVNILNTLRNQFLTDGLQLGLKAIGVAWAKLGDVMNLNEMVETKLEGRAALDVILRFEDGASETKTWIETANVLIKMKGDVSEINTNLVISADHA